MRQVARTAASRGQSGLTLIETILTIGLAGIMLVPMLGWAGVALDQQVSTIERNTRGASLGTLRTSFLDDVTASDRAWVDGADLVDCSGGEAAGGTPVLALAEGDARVVYVLADDGRGTSTSGLYRRSCAGPGEPATRSAMLVGGLDAALTSATCADGCRTVTLRLTTSGMRRTAMSATLRAAAADRSPRVVVTAEPPAGRRPLTVRFSSEGSVIPDPDGAVYLWDLGDGTTSDEVSPRHRYDRAGTYTATLTIATSTGASGSASVEVRVDDNPPTAVIAAPSEDLLTFRGVPVDFSAAGSNDDLDADAGGRIVSYLWDFGNGTTSNEPDPTVAYDTLSPEGGFTVTLTVTDDAGGTATAQRRVGVVNREPAVAVLADPLRGPDPLTVQFAALVEDETTMATNPPLKYFWELGDGSGSFDPVPPPVTYTGPGPRTITLTVVDDAGAEAVGSVVVEVDAASLAPPERFRLTQRGKQQKFRYMEFKWDRVEGAGSYEILLVCDGCDQVVSVTAGGTSQRINGLGPGRRWYVASIRALDPAGTPGEWSEPIRVRS